MMSRLITNMELYDDLTTINVTVGKLRREEDWKLKDSAAKWMPVFQSCGLPKMVSGYMERIFSIMQNKWSDTRNRCSVELNKFELIVALMLEQRCAEFFLNIGKNFLFLFSEVSNAEGHSRAA